MFSAEHPFFQKNSCGKDTALKKQINSAENCGKLLEFMKIPGKLWKNPHVLAEKQKLARLPENHVTTLPTEVAVRFYLGTLTLEKTSW